MEDGICGNLINFSDKTQIFNLNPLISNDFNSNNEFYDEKILKKFTRQIGDALEYRN